MFISNKVEESLIWQLLPETEKEDYLKFHRNSFREDIAHAEATASKFPRWSIISGYYAMHDVTKLFLAKEFGIKIVGQNTHGKTIQAITELINDPKLKSNIIFHLAKAKGIFFNAARLKEKTIPLLLKKGREERVKSQYYTQDFTSPASASAAKALYFLDTIVKPYIALMESLMKP